MNIVEEDREGRRKRSGGFLGTQK